MRIIGGIHRSRRLASPPEESTTRPMPDRVRQSIFDTLMAQGLVEDALVVDLFAGSGMMGLEALSRGARFCVFVERDRRPMDTIRKNLATLALTDQAAVVSQDALSTLWAGALPGGVGSQARVIFCDPPYPLTDDPAGLAKVYNLMARIESRIEPEGAFILRTRRQIDAAEVAGWIGPYSKDFGSTRVHEYYRPVAGAPATHATQATGDADTDTDGDADTDADTQMDEQRP